MQDSPRWMSRIAGWLSRAPREPDGGDAPRIKSRPIMDRMLKEIFVPELRAHGFTGSLPHFRRIRPDRIDLVTVQYSKYGGAFLVELSQCGPQGVAAGQGKEAPPDQVTARHLFSAGRYRLAFKAGSRGEWFAFDDDRRPAASEATLEAACRTAAHAALETFGRQAEPWWETSAGQRGISA